MSGNSFRCDQRSYPSSLLNGETIIGFDSRGWLINSSFSTSVQPDAKQIHSFIHQRAECESHFQCIRRAARLSLASKIRQARQMWPCEWYRIWDNEVFSPWGFVVDAFGCDYDFQPIISTAETTVFERKDQSVFSKSSCVRWICILCYRCHVWATLIVS